MKRNVHKYVLKTFFLLLISDSLRIRFSLEHGCASNYIILNIDLISRHFNNIAGEWGLDGDIVPVTNKLGFFLP